MPRERHDILLARWYKLIGMCVLALGLVLALTIWAQAQTAQAGPAVETEDEPPPEGTDMASYVRLVIVATRESALPQRILSVAAVSPEIPSATSS